MSMEMTGKFEQLLPEQTGQGRNGTWVKQSFVVSSEGQYPRQVCFDAWGDKADFVKRLRAGEMVKVSFEPESREYNGKWYTNLKAWRVESAGAAGGQAPSQAPSEYFPPSSPSAPPSAVAEDDLPF